MAIGAIKAFRENGIRVPEDIAVTGFDNCDLAEAMGLTTISIPNYERGYIAARYLVENIRAQKNVETFKIAAKIIYRNSVAEKKDLY
jgi:LacI family transcriptional regulator